MLLLENVPIQDSGVESFSIYFSKLESLVELDLRSCSFGDHGLLAVEVGLRGDDVLPNLHNLRMTGSPLLLTMSCLT